MLPTLNHAILLQRGRKHYVSGPKMYVSVITFHSIVLPVTVLRRSEASARGWGPFLWLWPRAARAAAQTAHTRAFMDRQVARMNTSCIKMRRKHYKVLHGGVHVIIFSPCVIYTTPPYGLPGDLPRKCDLSSQIASVMIAPNCQHLSVGFICFVSGAGCVPVRAHVRVNMNPTRCWISAQMCYYY